MGDETSDSDMKESGGDQSKDITQSIPGGERKTLSEEPQLPEVSTKDLMGCAQTAAADGAAPMETESESKVGQPTTDQYNKPNEKRGDTARPDNEDQSLKKSKVEDKKPNNQSKSKVSVKSGSDDDDDNENKSHQRHTGPVTRSSTSLTKLRITFENSDDENDDSRYSSWAQEDIAQYRNNYPHARSNPNITDNYDFYTNKIRSHPDGDYIDNIHKDWFGNYRKLEYHHGYIQWLFPLQEKGLNWSAEPLQKHEIESIKKDEKALKRILKSYKLMLDFYGFELIDDKTGELRRLPNGAYKEQFDNLNTSSHNYLRITRILKCLGEFDYEYLKFPFLAAILREGITENTLSNCLRSCKDYWIGTLRSQKERRAIRQYARDLIEYRNKEISPPKSHRAERPASSSSTSKARKVSPGKNNNDNNPNE